MQPMQPRPGQIWLHCLHCLAGGFYALQSRISCRICFEHLMHTLHCAKVALMYFVTFFKILSANFGVLKWWAIWNEKSYNYSKSLRVKILKVVKMPIGNMAAGTFWTGLMNSTQIWETLQNKSIWNVLIFLLLGVQEITLGLMKSDLQNRKLKSSGMVTFWLGFDIFFIWSH